MFLDLRQELVHMNNRESKSEYEISFKRREGVQWGYIVNPQEKLGDHLLHALLQRGSEIAEVSEISGIPLKYTVSDPNIEEKSMQDLPLSGDDERTIKFVKALHREGFIDDSLFGWHMLLKLYILEERELPKTLGEKIRLEAFLLAKLAQRSGDQKPIIAYNTLGSEIDSEWFGTSLAEEEDYISNVIMKASMGAEEDERGFYHEDKDGNRWREPMEFGENGVIYDNTEIALQRALIRDANKRR